MRPADRTALRSLAARTALCGALGGLALGLSVLAAFGREHALMINVSPSLPYWAIWLDRGAVPQVGDIVLFDPPASALLAAHFGVAPKPFGKLVAGVPGDAVTRKGRTFFVNGREVAKAKTVSLRGEPLALGPEGVLPHSCYFVATPHKDGFDSRYAAIGWVCGRRVLGVGKPIL